MNAPNAQPKPPSKTADRKALAAYFSELRRWAERLSKWETETAEWELDLDEREIALEQALNAAPDSVVQNYADSLGATIVDDDECECTEDEARDGCDCPPCRAWRRGQLEGAEEHAANVQVKHEIKELEALWKLEDKRK